MLIEVQDGKSVQKFEVIDSEMPSFESLKKFSKSRKKISQMIESLSISADAKALMFKASDTVISFGKVLLPIGRVIFGAALELLKIFPTLTLAIILAKFLPLLVPIWLVKIKLVALIAKFLPYLGAYTDIKDNIINDKFGDTARKIAAKFFPQNAT